MKIGCLEKTFVQEDVMRIDNGGDETFSSEDCSRKRETHFGVVVSANMFAPKRIGFYTGERFIVDDYKEKMTDLIVEAPLPSEHFDSDWVKNTLSRELVQYMELLVKSDVGKNDILVSEMLEDFFRQNSSIGGKVNIAGTMYFNLLRPIQIMLVSYMKC